MHYYYYYCTRCSSAKETSYCLSWFELKSAKVPSSMRFLLFTGSPMWATCRKWYIGDSAEWLVFAPALPSLYVKSCILLFKANGVITNRHRKTWRSTVASQADSITSQSRLPVCLCVNQGVTNHRPITAAWADLYICTQRPTYFTNQKNIGKSDLVCWVYRSSCLYIAVLLAELHRRNELLLLAFVRSRYRK